MPLCSRGKYKATRQTGIPNDIRLFIAQGYHWVDAPDRAQVVLINTCSVRELAEQKVWSQLGRLGGLKRSERPDLVMVHFDFHALFFQGEAEKDGAT